MWNLPWLNPRAQLRAHQLDMEVASFHRHKVSITSFYIYHTYRALRANAKWGCGCEFPLCPLLALDLAWVPLNPISCAAAWQRWVTRPVNDKSRLGRKLEHTEVHKTCCHPPQEDFTAAVYVCSVMPEVVCTWVCTLYISERHSAGYTVHCMCVTNPSVTW